MPKSTPTTYSIVTAFIFLLRSPPAPALLPYRGRSLPDKRRCAWVIASNSASRSSCLFFDAGTVATNRFAAAVRVCSVSAMSPCVGTCDADAARANASFRRGPTYICGAAGLSFINSGRENTPMIPPYQQTKTNDSHTVLDSRRKLHRGASAGGGKRTWSTSRRIPARVADLAIVLRSATHGRPFGLSGLSGWDRETRGRSIWSVLLTRSKSQPEKPDRPDEPDRLKRKGRTYPTRDF